MGTPAREAATATGCQQNINLSTAMAAFGKTVFTNFDEFRPFLDQIRNAIPSYAVEPFISIMKVLFRKGTFLVNISDVSNTKGTFTGGTFKCNMVFSYKELLTGEIRFYAQKFQQVRKIRNSNSYCYQRIYTEHKFIFITFDYKRIGNEKSFPKRKKLSFRSYPMTGKNPTRPHNQQPKYRKFMTSVISSMFIDGSNDATEYVMDQ
jgi:hypothetical protein